ncbi:MAG TPA: ATP12 family protein [Methylocella sp.]|nr:ATP12 family protein [Methylocella sp.]
MAASETEGLEGSRTKLERRRDLKNAYPCRFYREASIKVSNGTFALCLDGRLAKTPAGNVLALPSRAASQAVLSEWEAQGETIDFAAMPLTRIVHSAIDGVTPRLEKVAAEIRNYAGSDLVCYRAGEPEELVEAQADAWDRVLVFAQKKLGASFIRAEGVVFSEQPPAALSAVDEALASIAACRAAAPFKMAALFVMTTLTGSALLALAVAYGEMTAAEAWFAAHVDEDFEMRRWGEDAQALFRREQQWREMAAAAGLFRAVSF